LSIYYGFDCNDTSFWYLEASDSGCMNQVKYFTFDLSIYAVIECYYGNNSNFSTGYNVSNTSTPVVFNSTNSSPYNVTYLSTLETFNNTLETTYFNTTDIEFNNTIYFTYNVTNEIETTDLISTTENAIPQSGKNITVLNGSLLCLNEPRIFISVCVNHSNYKCYENDNNTNIECYLINDNPHNCTDNIGNTLLCYDVKNATTVTSTYISCLFQEYYSIHKRSSNNSNNFIYCSYNSSNNNNNNSGSVLNWYLIKLIGIPVLAAIILLCCCFIFFCCCNRCCRRKKATKKRKKMQ